MSKTSKGNARIRTWAYTVQNLSDSDYIAVENLNENEIAWSVHAVEKGEKNEQTHFQCAIRFKHGKTFTAAQKFLGLKPGDELASMRSAEFTNAAYCLKGEQCKDEWNTDGVDGDNYGLNAIVLRQIGTLPLRGDGKVSIWDDIVQAVKDGWTDLDLVEKWPDQAVRCQSAIAKYRLTYERQNAGWRNLEVTYLNGLTGSGKSRFVMETYGYPNVYRVQNYDSGAFDEYDGQDVVLFEEFRNGFKIEQMLNFLDGYPLQLPARYANKMAKFTKVFIATNWNLNEQYKSIQEKYPSTWDAFLRRINYRAEVLDDSMCFWNLDGDAIKSMPLPWLCPTLDREEGE